MNLNVTVVVFLGLLQLSTPQFGIEHDQCFGTGADPQRPVSKHFFLNGGGSRFVEGTINCRTIFLYRRGLFPEYWFVRDVDHLLDPRVLLHKPGAGKTFAEFGVIGVC